MKPKKTIGLDAAFREVFPGDEVIDADGVSYTILDNGWAKPATGGTEVAFKRLKDPMVADRAPLTVPGDHTQARKFTEGPDGKVGPASSHAEPAGPAKTEEPAPAPVPAKSPHTRKPASRVGIGGKRNKSGWSKLFAIVKPLGISGIGLTGYLRDHGFDVYRAEGTSCVKVEDREKVIDFLRQNPPPPGLPKTSSYDGTVRRIRNEVKDERKVSGTFKTEAPAPAETPAPRVTITKADALWLLSEADMVAELRARGWTVTCSKTESL